MDPEVGLEPGSGAGHSRGRHRQNLRLPHASLLRRDARLHRHAIRHPVQPAAQGLADADRPCLSGQDEERGLEGVLNVVLVPQDGPTSGQDHRSVPRHQGLKRLPILRSGVPRQELAVGQTDDRPAAEKFAQVLHGCP